LQNENGRPVIRALVGGFRFTVCFVSGRLRRRGKNVDSSSKSNPLRRREKNYDASTWRRRRRRRKK